LKKVIRAVKGRIQEVVPVEAWFTRVYRKDRFGGKDSASGPGSDLEQTRIISREIPSLLRELGVSSMLDAPCGDLHWMSHVDLDGVQYIGADVVAGLVRAGTENFGRMGSFLHLDITRDRLPEVELIFCRDCLVHLSFRRAMAAVANFRASGARYLLTTTFPGTERNEDIPTGGWRPLNLSMKPFDLGSPLKVINEGCTEGEGGYADKSLGLWPLQGGGPGGARG
jgi:hypothetical protein